MHRLQCQGACHIPGGSACNSCFLLRKSLLPGHSREGRDSQGREHHTAWLPFIYRPCQAPFTTSSNPARQVSHPPGEGTEAQGRREEGFGPRSDHPKPMHPSGGLRQRHVLGPMARVSGSVVQTRRGAEPPRVGLPALQPIPPSAAGSSELWAEWRHLRTPQGHRKGQTGVWSPGKGEEIPAMPSGWKLSLLPPPASLPSAPLSSPSISAPSRVVFPPPWALASPYV